MLLVWDTGGDGLALVSVVRALSEGVLQNAGQSGQDARAPVRNLLSKTVVFC